MRTSFLFPSPCAALRSTSWALPKRQRLVMQVRLLNMTCSFSSTSPCAFASASTQMSAYAPDVALQLISLTQRIPPRPPILLNNDRIFSNFTQPSPRPPPPTDPCFRNLSLSATTPLQFSPPMAPAALHLIPLHIRSSIPAEPLHLFPEPTARPDIANSPP